MLHWQKDYLDVILVPCGLVLMFGYHPLLVYKYLKSPETTVIGYQNHNKRAWVRRIFEVDVKERGPAISVFSSHITAATALLSISLAPIFSLAATSMAAQPCPWFTSSIYPCFLVAFASSVQTTRYLIRVNFLISMPDNNIPVSCVVTEVIKGSNFWLIGLRSLYFATNLLLWIFGHIPMFLCSVIMVVLLFNFDAATTPLHHCKHLMAVIGSNLSAATSFASISLALSSLIGAWIGSSYHNDYITKSIYGNTTATLVYIKYIALLSSLMVAFACFVQTARCFVHANFLISMPNCEMPVSNVERAVISGSNFWLVGLRSLYFATNLLLWIFGPIPMFVSSVITVLLLQYLDKNTASLPQYNPSVSYDSSKKIDRQTIEDTGKTIKHHEETEGTQKGT